MSSKEVDQFFKWAKEVENLLEQNTEESLNALPEKYRWLSYREAKILTKEPDNYNDIESTFIQLSAKCAKQLQKNNHERLKEAQKHRIGTKARLKKIMLYVYYYENCIHFKLLSGKMKNDSTNIIEKFWAEYLDELVQYRKMLNPYQFSWLIEFRNLSKDVGVEVDAQKFSQIERDFKLSEKLEEEKLLEHKLVEEFERDLDTWENQKVEFKKRSKSNTERAESIAGFATADGGRIYLGVGPDKTVEGIEGIDSGKGRDDMQRQIFQITIQNVKPS